MKCSIAIVLSVALVGLLSAACNRDEPPPQFPHGVGEGGQLRPVSLTRLDKGILGQAAGTGEGGGARAEAGGGAGEGHAVTIDDSSAQAAAESVVALLKAGRLGDLHQIVVPDQEDELQQVLSAMQPLLDAARELQAASAEKFSGHAVVIPGLALTLPPEAAVAHVQVDENNSEAAEASIEVPGASQPSPLKLRQVDGKWRVEIPNLTMAAALVSTQQANLARAAESLRSLTARVNDGEITDAAQLDAAIRQAAGGAPPPDQGNSLPDGNTAEPTEESTSATPDPQPRQRDQVDEVYSGPGQLRAR